MCKWVPVIFILFTALPAARAQEQLLDSVPVYTIEEGFGNAADLGGFSQLRIDHEKTLSIEDLLVAQTQSIGPSNMEEHSLEFPLVAWLSLKLENDKPEALDAYLSFCSQAEEVIVYSASRGEILSVKHTGKALPPLTKSLPATGNYVPINLMGHESKSYHIRLLFSEPVGRNHLSEVSLRAAPALIHRIIGQYAFQSFYSGTMLAFILLSAFVFYMFRNRIFILFGLLQGAFLFYFLCVSNSVDAVLPFGILRGDWLNYLAIAFLVVALFLFESQYINMKRHLPRYYVAYLTVSILSALFPFVMLLLGYALYEIGSIQNIILILWVVMTIIPVGVLSYKRHQAARNLLIALGVLFVTSLFYLFYLLGYFPPNLFSKYGIQMGSIFFSLLLLYWLFENVRAVQAENRHISAIDQLKTRLFANISHEFRTPLTLLMGPVNDVLERTKDSEDRKLLKMAKSNAQRLLNLVHQLLDLAKLQSGGVKVRLSQVVFDRYLRGIVMSYQSLAEKQNIRLHYHSAQEDIQLWLDKEKAEMIFNNLITNAFKHTPEGGAVSTSVQQQGGLVHVSISDTGSGIDEAALPYIFDRFFQSGDAAATVQGAGIGLSIAKEYVNLHQGSIKAESRQGQGTTFKLCFKKGSEHFEGVEGVEWINEFSNGRDTAEDKPLVEEANARENVAQHLPKEPIMKHTPEILLIEDSADVREFIKLQLRKSFRIREAATGEEGLQISLKHTPDLIITDVMMPEMNGFEVVKRLKTEVRTGHIPIIMLTASAARPDKLKGLEYGADDYLIKPFDTKELEVRIRKLIEGRVELRKRMMENPTLSFKPVTGSAADKNFLEKLKSVIEGGIDNEKLTSEFVAEEMGMSSTHLNRKIKALANVTTTQYIRHYRLKKALEMLENDEGNVSEVAFRTGFGSTAYFVKCFREQFGKTPGSILSNAK